MILVTFESRYDESLGWDNEDNVSPYISIANPESDIQNQRQPDEIVIPLTTIKIEYDYPLSCRVIFEHTNLAGFTRADLARLVSQDYHHIYDEEVETSATEIGLIPGMFNRTRSNGTYGIWGHEIGDLVLRQVRQMNDNIFCVSVDS